MEKRFAAIGRTVGGINRLGRHSHRQRHRSAGQAFGQAQDIGHHARLIAGEQRAGATPAGHDFVGDEQHTMRAANRRHLTQNFCRIKQHTPCAEHQRLDDQRGGAGRAAGNFKRGQRGIAVAGGKCAGKRDHADIEQQRRIGRVEQPTRADRHRADRIAVIAVFHHQDAGAPGSGMRMKAERHFQRDFDRGRSAVGKEHPGQVGGHQCAQAFGNGFGGRVSPPGKDDLIQPFGLIADRGDDARVVVAVCRHPPTRHRVDHPAPVAGIQRGALRTVYQRDRLVQPVLGKRVPDRAHVPVTLI